MTNKIEYDWITLQDIIKVGLYQISWAFGWIFTISTIYTIGFHNVVGMWMDEKFTD